MSSGRAIERSGWSFVFPSLVDERLRDELIEAALEAASGKGGHPIRRTLHASTRMYELNSAQGVCVEAFVKVLDAKRGIAAIKRKLRGSRAMHVARIEKALNASGINAPEVLLAGVEQSTGREIIATRRAEGVLAARHVGPYRESLARKREVLRALGVEVAKLHRAGFIHGDLTPFNVVVASGNPLRIVFIDHERTSRSGAGRWRPRLRNLVQLGHYALPGLTNMDRMRVWRSYAAASGALPAVRRRAIAMLKQRVARDGGLAPVHQTPTVNAQQLQEGDARAS